MQDNLIHSVEIRGDEITKKDGDGKVLYESPNIRLRKLIIIYPTFVEKIENLIFWLAGINYRQRITLSFFKNLEKRAGLIKVSNSRNADDDKKILEARKLESLTKNKPIPTIITEHFDYAIGRDIDYEVFSFITFAVTLIDNTIDLLLNLNDKPSTKNKHWDLANFLKDEKLQNAIDSEITKFIINENETWIKNLTEERHTVIHRIAEKTGIHSFDLKRTIINDGNNITDKADVEFYTNKPIDEPPDQKITKYYEKIINFLEVIIKHIEK